NARGVAGARNWSPLLVSRDGPARVEPPDAAVAMSQAVFAFIHRCLAAEVSLDPFANRCRIVGVHKREPVARVIEELMILETEQLLEHRIGVEFAGDEVPVPHADTTGEGRAPIPVVSVHDAHDESRPSKWPT